MKILITGSSGLLGRYLELELSKNHEILATYSNNKENFDKSNFIRIDIRHGEKLNELFDSFRPELTIHTAAFTNPILSSDTNPKEVYDINVNSTKKIAELCDKYSVKLVYTSSDLVYAGYRGSMLDENSKLIPVSLYAETKLMGEVKIQETFDNYMILRIALLFGLGLGKKKNHFEVMYNNLKNNNPVKLFYDQYRTPISLKEAARIIGELCDKNIKKEIINVGGRERVNRVEMGERLCDIAGFNKSLIQKISVKDIPDYPAVEDVSMNTEKLQSFGIKIKGIEESIKEILN